MQSWSDRWYRGELEATTIRLQSKFPNVIIALIKADLAPRYFQRSKLDYPNAETTRASRKYVRAMKPLTVSRFVPGLSLVL
jgi:hypothetical protein